MKPFKNEPFTDFSKAKPRGEFLKALAAVHREMGKEYPLVIGGERLEGKDRIASINPSHKEQTLATFNGASVEQAKQAIEVAAQTFESWKQVPAKKRSDYLFKVAALLRKRKHFFSAILVLE